MSFMLGFGSTEEAQRKQVYDWMLNKLKELSVKYHQEKEVFYLRELIDDFTKELNDYCNKLRDDYEILDKQRPRPERYFHAGWTPRIASHLDVIFVYLEFWHINSKHALSPDGMALWEYPETYSFTVKEVLK